MIRRKSSEPNATITTAICIVKKEGDTWIGLGNEKKQRGVHQGVTLRRWDELGESFNYSHLPIMWLTGRMARDLAAVSKTWNGVTGTVR